MRKLLAIIFFLLFLAGVPSFFSATLIASNIGYVVGAAIPPAICLFGGIYFWISKKNLEASSPKINEPKEVVNLSSQQKTTDDTKGELAFHKIQNSSSFSNLSITAIWLLSVIILVGLGLVLREFSQTISNSFQKTSTLVSNDNYSYDDECARIVGQFKEKLPLQIDSVTMLNSVTFAPGEIFTYKYTLLDRSAQTMNISDFENSMRVHLTENYKNSKEMKFFRENNAAIRFQYADRDGHYITSIVIEP